MSEECETGEQGGLIVGFYSLVLFGGKLVLAAVRLQSTQHDELPTAKAASAVSTRTFCSGFRATARMESSYLVDPASSHMLVSKIKPCMSKYKQICTVKLRMAH